MKQRVLPEVINQIKMNLYLSRPVSFNGTFLFKNHMDYGKENDQ